MASNKNRKKVDEFRFQEMKFFGMRKIEREIYCFSHLESLNAECAFGLSGMSSKKLREEGNALYNKPGRTEDDVRQACEKYTLAMMASDLPKDGGDESYSLASANRAAALKDLGYLNEALDDCKIALDNGYPEEKRAKILSRKESCARAISQLLTCDPCGENCVGSSCKICEARKYEAMCEKEEKLDAMLHKLTLQNTLEKFKIIENQTSVFGCDIVATDLIKNGECIFTERYLCSVIPNSGAVCARCAKTFFVPYACNGCKGFTCYCSVACRVEDFEDHRYVCKLNRYSFYRKLKATPQGLRIVMALKLVTKFLPTVVPLLKHLSSGAEIWKQLDLAVRCTANDGKIMPGELPELLKNTEYYQIMKQDSYFDFNDIIKNSSELKQIEIFVHYLENHTDFFDIFKDAAASAGHWSIVVAALMTRHLNQLFLTAVIIPRRCAGSSLLFLENTWSKAGHMQRGYMHAIRYASSYGVGLLSPRNKCNHACNPSAFFTSDGCAAKYYALDDISASTEITVNYKSDLCRLMYDPMCNDFHRRIEAKCCLQKNINAPTHEIHEFEFDYFTYRCPDCTREFTFSLPWETLILDVELEERKCRFCGTSQRLSCNLFIYFMHTETNTRLATLLALHECWRIREHLPKHSTLYFDMQGRVLRRFLDFHHKGIVSITGRSQDLIGRMLRWTWSGPVPKFRRFIWNWWPIVAATLDMIALGKLTFTDAEKSALREELDFLPTELKQIASNYYNDYIS